MDFDEYETLPTNNVTVHMSAGAVAGIMEHCVMYPFDSVKTRMQSLTPTVKFNTIRETLVGMVKYEGTFRPYRGRYPETEAEKKFICAVNNHEPKTARDRINSEGVGAVVTGAGPAHALYFSSYEFFKEKLYSSTSLPKYVVPGLSGVVATLLHDGIMVPSEVVKQRLQMYNSPYKSIFDCVRRTYRTEGIAAFYRSYTTQVSMSLPFQCIHFMTYEIGQNLLNKDKTYNPKAHIVSGGLAGGIAAAVTTPLDVIKTLLNTQQHRVSGMVDAFKTVYRLSGPSGYFKGLQARIIYHVPSAAICWSTYEFLKYTFVIKYPSSSKCKDIPSAGFVSSERENLSNKLKPGLLLVAAVGVPEANLEAGITKSSMEDTFFHGETEGAEGRLRITGSDNNNNNNNSNSVIERTFIDKNDWNSRGTGILAAALNFRDDENKTRGELLDVTHS